MFLQKNGDINKSERTLVLKGIFSETTYLYVLPGKFKDSRKTLTSFRHGGGGRIILLSPPIPTSKRTPLKPTQIRVKSSFKIENTSLGCLKKSHISLSANI